MIWWRVAKARLRGLFHGETLEQDIDEELRCHMDILIEENIKRGMTPEEARLQAIRSFGNLGRIKDSARDVRGGGMIEVLWQDIRFGMRMLVKDPAFTVVALLALALGIGANTAIFSVVNGILLRPLPYNDPEKIITIWEPSRGGHTLGLTDLEFFDVRDQNQVFENVAAYATGATNLTGGGEPERITGTWVSSGFFPVLGVHPMLGRTFTAEDDTPSPARVVVVSHGLWQRRFASNSNIIGRQVSLNGINRTIIGVMPRGFQFDHKDVELWLPLGLDRANLNPGNRSYSAIARLKPGVTLEQARSHMNNLMAHLAQAYKKRFTNGVNATNTVNLIPLHELLVGNIRPALLILFAAIGFVLLIACANVANLLLARSDTRQKEIAIRMALGVGRLRIVKQLLTESVILSMLGGALGFLLAYWGVGAMIALAPASLPRTSEIGLDVTVLTFTLAVSLLSGVVFGLVPGLQSSNPNLLTVIKEGGAAKTGNWKGRRTRQMLVISEIALAMVLVAGAGLMIKSFVRLLTVDPGFNPKNVLTARINLPPSKYSQRQQVDAFYKQLIERIETSPGVNAVGTITVLPLSGLNSNASFEIEGRPRVSDEVEQNADYRMVSLDYFHAMGISLLKGRHFAPSDHEDAPGVVIINESMADDFWRDQETIGKRINLAVPGSPWLTIIGVIKNVKHKALDVESKPEMYFLQSQNAYANALGLYPSVTFAVRGSSDPLSMSGTVKNAVKALDKDVPVASIETMEKVLSDSVAQPRFIMLLLAIFAIVALALAAVGVYGMMAYSVTQRRHEIGIRIALGAQAGNILKLVVRQGMLLAVIGVVIGLGLAFALTRVITGLLFEVSATDPQTFIGISILLPAVSLVALLVPARRALSVDPIVTLRYE
ncbi:ABC transporter permease [bacterium]|nr:ABC transporter permease [bacterium]